MGKEGFFFPLIPEGRTSLPPLSSREQDILFFFFFESFSTEDREEEAPAADLSGL